VLLGFPELVTRLGGDPAAILRRRNIDPSAVGNEDRFLSTAAVAAVVVDAAEALGCADFAMRLGREQGIQMLGPIAVIIRHSETFAAAVDGVSRYLHNVAPPDHVELLRSQKAAVFTLTTTVPLGPARDHWIEKGLAVAMEAFRLMLGEDFTPLRVTMQHRRLSAAECYQETFSCPIKFESELNSIHVPRSLLTRPIRGRDAAALALAERYLTEIGPDLAVVDHVRDLTVRLLAANQAALPLAARAMSLHPRVLQRRLAEAGTTFDAILDDVRRVLAWDLSATGMSITRISSTLGYAEQSSFTRACRRWYGESPRQLVARRRREATEQTARQPG
jgi:AraC-like DNA-binding protein